MRLEAVRRTLKTYIFDDQRDRSIFVAMPSLKGTPPATLIANKTYLQPGFDATGLSVVQLRSILNHHGIEYPTSGPKAPLVQLFNEKIGVVHHRSGSGLASYPDVQAVRFASYIASPLPTQKLARASLVTTNRPILSSER